MLVALYAGDVAFEASGSPAGVQTASHALRVRGRLVVVAIHSQPVPVDLFRVFWRELELIGARVYAPVGVGIDWRVLQAARKRQSGAAVVSSRHFDRYLGG